MTGKLSPLRVIAKWRRDVKLISEAVKEACPSAEVYITGGAAENRLTVTSDIDVLVVLPYKPSFAESVELRVKILEKAEELGLPPYAPVELHIIGREELESYLKKGKVILVESLNPDKLRKKRKNN